VFFILFDIMLIVMGILSNQILPLYIGIFLLGGSFTKFIDDYREYKEKKKIEEDL